MTIPMMTITMATGIITPITTTTKQLPQSVRRAG
jgi:hypothetical protein